MSTFDEDEEWWCPITDRHIQMVDYWDMNWDDLDEEQNMSGCGGCDKSCAGKPKDHECDSEKKCDGKCEDCKCDGDCKCKKCECDMETIMSSGCKCGGK